jgi:hypothetical protein
MLLETANDRGIVRVAGAGPCVDDEIHRGQLVLILAEGLAYQALDAIAPDCTADDAGGDRKSKAWSLATGVSRKYCEQSIGETARITIDAVEFGFLPEALCRFERPRVSLQVEGERTLAPLAAAGTLDRQTFATLRTASGEHQTAGSGSHARAKAMGALTFNFARLVSALHAGSLQSGAAVKVALKQAHGGLKRRAGRVRSQSSSVKRAARRKAAAVATKIAHQGCG